MLSSATSEHSAKYFTIIIINININIWNSKLHFISVSSAEYYKIALPQRYIYYILYIYSIFWIYTNCFSRSVQTNISIYIVSLFTITIPVSIFFLLYNRSNRPISAALILSLYILLLSLLPSAVLFWLLLYRTCLIIAIILTAIYFINSENIY